MLLLERYHLITAKYIILADEMCFIAHGDSFSRGRQILGMLNIIQISSIGLSNFFSYSQTRRRKIRERQIKTLQQKHRFRKVIGRKVF